MICSTIQIEAIQPEAEVFPFPQGYIIAMNALQQEIAALLMNKGASLVGFADITGLPALYRHSMRSALSIAATRAGLGWVGKSDLLITRKYGAAHARSGLPPFSAMSSSSRERPRTRRGAASAWSACSSALRKPSPAATGRRDRIVCA